MLCKGWLIRRLQKLALTLKNLHLSPHVIIPKKSATKKLIASSKYLSSAPAPLH